MDSVLAQIVLGLLTSALGGALVWSGQRLGRLSREARLRGFLGVTAGEPCLLLVGRHAAGTERSVHHHDVGALVELAVLIKRCGAEPEVRFAGLPGEGDQGMSELGRRPEFCVGGPGSNPRSGLHLRRKVPGVVFADPGAYRQVTVGTREFTSETATLTYAAIVKVAADRPAGHPVFLICGQRAFSNDVAARYLVANAGRLSRRYGTGGRFCLVLGIVDAGSFGGYEVESVVDMTAAAFTAP